MTSKPIDPQAAIETLWNLAPKFAAARAERIYLEEFRKSLKSIKMKESGLDAIGAQERDAYAHPEYLAHLQGLRSAVELEETLRWRLISAQTAVEVWRSQKASNRMIERATA